MLGRPVPLIQSRLIPGAPTPLPAVPRVPSAAWSRAGSRLRSPQQLAASKGPLFGFTVFLPPACRDLGRIKVSLQRQINIHQHKSPSPCLAYGRTVLVVENGSFPAQAKAPGEAAGAEGGLPGLPWVRFPFGIQFH